MATWVCKKEVGSASFGVSADKMTKIRTGFGSKSRTLFCFKNNSSKTNDYNHTESVIRRSGFSEASRSRVKVICEPTKWMPKSSAFYVYTRAESKSVFQLG
jgi:hypothetical protein